MAYAVFFTASCTSALSELDKIQMTTTCTGATRGGSTRPLLSPCTITHTPICTHGSNAGEYKDSGDRMKGASKRTWTFSDTTATGQRGLHGFRTKRNSKSQGSCGNARCGW